MLFRGFKRRAPRAIKAVKKFAEREMRTPDVRIDPKLNKVLWSRGIRFVKCALLYCTLVYSMLNRQFFYSLQLRRWLFTHLCLTGTCPSGFAFGLRGSATKTRMPRIRCTRWWRTWRWTANTCAAKAPFSSRTNNPPIYTTLHYSRVYYFALDFFIYWVLFKYKSRYLSNCQNT